MLMDTAADSPSSTYATPTAKSEANAPEFDGAFFPSNTNQKKVFFSPSSIEGQIRQSQGNGTPMPPTLQREMEDGFGADFSQVNIHQNAQAQQMSSALHAKAFTVGSDIYFNQGQFDPGSNQGKTLLAHELTHTIQQGSSPAATVSRKVEESSPSTLLIHRQESDGGVPDGGVTDGGVPENGTQPDPNIHDAGVPGGVPMPEQPQPSETGENGTQPQQQGLPSPTHQAQAAPACTTQYTKASNFSTLITLVEAAETKLTAAGISSTQDQIHSIRGIFYGTTWSKDFADQHDTFRNTGFQEFTQPSKDPATTTPKDVTTILDCGLFKALWDSQDATDGTKTLDFGHLVIGLDARFDPTRNNEVIHKQPVLMFTKDVAMGGAGTELVTWLGDLGGGAGTLAAQRASTPSKTAADTFHNTQSDYGASNNLEGDVAAFVAAKGSGTGPVTEPDLSGGKQLSDILKDYLGPSSASYKDRAKTFLTLYGGVFDPTSHALTNGPDLVKLFAGKIQAFACNYLVSRVVGKKLAGATAKAAATNVIPASEEIASMFVDALTTSMKTGGPIVAGSAPPAKPAAGAACGAQLSIVNTLDSVGIHP
jgi:hypothetical protein